MISVTKMVFPAYNDQALRLILWMFCSAFLANAALAQDKTIDKAMLIEKEVGVNEVHVERSKITRKIHEIVIPEIDLNHVTIDQAVDYLRIRSAELDFLAREPDEAGITIVVRHLQSSDKGFFVRRIRSLKLKDVTLADALQRLCYAVGYQLVIRTTDVLLVPNMAFHSDRQVTAQPNLYEKKELMAEEVVPERNSGSSDLSKALSPLVSPDLASAKMVIENLQKLALSKSGAEKVAAEQMCSVVRNMFASEFLVTTKIRAIEKSEADAKQQEMLAAQWLKPNAFGTVNRDAARAARERAAEIRKNARRELAEARDTLKGHLRNADVSVMLYAKRNDVNVVTLLGEAMHAINQRSLPPDTFRATLSTDEIRNMRVASKNSNDQK